MDFGTLNSYGSELLRSLQWSLVKNISTSHAFGRMDEALKVNINIFEPVMYAVTKYTRHYGCDLLYDVLDAVDYAKVAVEMDKHFAILGIYGIRDFGVDGASFIQSRTFERDLSLKETWSVYKKVFMLTAEFVDESHYTTDHHWEFEMYELYIAQ